jgi:hypothetical protein
MTNTGVVCRPKRTDLIPMRNFRVLPCSRAFRARTPRCPRGAASATPEHKTGTGSVAVEPPRGEVVFKTRTHLGNLSSNEAHISGEGR